MRAVRAVRDAFHRARPLAPQRPLGRPAPGFPGFAAWPPQPRFSTPLHPRESLRTLGSWAPVHAPRCQRETRFSGPRCRLPTSATLKRRASTPYERPILAREWSFRSATRRHQPMPVALPRDTLPHRGAASLDLHPPACARRVPLSWTRANRGPKRSRKGEPRALGRCRACPSRGASGTRVAGSSGDEAWRTASLFAPA